MKKKVVLSDLRERLFLCGSTDSLSHGLDRDSSLEEGATTEAAASKRRRLRLLGNGEVSNNSHHFLYIYIYRNRWKKIRIIPLARKNKSDTISLDKNLQKLGDFNCF
ncbi:MAG: hypothetical protein IJO79_03205 [Firmicutes bacterium]|nr:hypothetical protein [Bacillota bacterium]